MNFGALRSKTVWFAIVQAAAAGAFVILQDGLTEASLSLMVTSVLTVVFRALTDKPLSAK